jgi:hypothetical protein
MVDKLPIGLSKLWDSLERYAKARLDETGLLEPIGMMESVDHKNTLLAPFQVFEQVKGLPPSTKVRMVQDMVFNAVMEKQPAVVGIVYGADLAPVEGGDESPGLVGWLEESSGLAIQVVTHFAIQSDGIVLGERQIIPRKPILLAKDDSVPRPDVGRGRFGQLDIRPRINFRVAPDLTLDEAADLLLLLALDPQKREEDWKAVSSIGIDNGRFLFERVCLRTAAVVISLIHIDSEAIRHNVEARFWDRMEERVSPDINGSSQVYFEAFRNSERLQGSKVFSEFSIRCSGAEQAELVSFAQKAFGMLMVICREWLKKHGIKP